MTLTDDEIFERQQIRKQANREPIVPVAVLRGQPRCGRDVFWRRDRTPARPRSRARP